jgi:hypothetical protein
MRLAKVLGCVAVVTVFTFVVAVRMYAGSNSHMLDKPINRFRYTCPTISEIPLVNVWLVHCDHHRFAVYGDHMPGTVNFNGVMLSSEEMAMRAYLLPDAPRVISPPPKPGSIRRPFRNGGSGYTK